MTAQQIIDGINAVIRDLVVLDSQEFPGKSPPAIGRAYRYLNWAREAIDSLPKGVSGDDPGEARPR